MSGAIKPTKSLFIYEGYLKVVVLTDMIVETSLLICVKVGLLMCNLSEAIRFKAVLSRTTTQSAHWVSLFNVNNELYGCTTTSLQQIKIQDVYTNTSNLYISCQTNIYLISSWLGKTLYVSINFLGNLSARDSNMKDPMPEPVPPAIEWHKTKP